VARIEIKSGYGLDFEASGACCAWRARSERGSA
jgi:hypothetical protein